MPGDWQLEDLQRYGRVSTQWQWEAEQLAGRAKISGMDVAIKHIGVVPWDRYEVRVRNRRASTARTAEAR